MRAAIVVQSHIRGYVCRQVIKVWHQHRVYHATRIQALYRGYYIRQVLVTWKQWESINARRIQSLIRGYFARQYVRTRQQHIAVLHIQALWRGFSTRRRSDQLWLSTKVIELQRLVRGALARKRVQRQIQQSNAAATHIQRLFRGTQGRALVNSMLRDRETENRQVWMRVLEVEEEWYQQRRDRLQTRLERFHLWEQ